MSVEDFFEEFTQEFVAQAGADSNFIRSSFIEYLCGTLEEEGYISGFAQTDYRHTTLGMAVDAWSFDAELACLTLFVADYRDSCSLETLTNSDIKTSFSRLRKFITKSLESGFPSKLEETAPATELAWMIHDSQKEIARINLVLISNANLSARVATLPSEELPEFSTSYEIWDINRLFRIRTSGKAREDLWLDFSTMNGGGIQCLPAFIGEGAIESYLLVLPGAVLADLYGQHGERLLEQNVRTFLQFRGNINKGIRNTIVNEPHMFFSYNNGLAVTAEEVDADQNNTLIKRVRNLQIVNGGQTTASIFNAMKKEKADLQNVYVQIKLSVVPPEKVEEIVPRISQYSNTQNKVNAADFFSNHPFHLQIEEFSRRLWAPSSDGMLQQTHWFYERARGQYANQQANLTPTQKKKFLIMNPRNQMFTKTDLAKFWLSFEEVPNEVSAGAQKAFSGSARNPGFVGRISKSWEKDEGKSINELWFKRAVAKAIIFRQVDKLVFKQDWYAGYKANIVTYSIAKFANMVRQDGRCIDFEKIWNEQTLPAPLVNQFEEITEVVNDILISPPSDTTANVTEWAKKELCWKHVKEEEIDLLDEVEEYLIQTEIKKDREKSAVRTQVIQNSIHAQTYVVEKGSSHWQTLRDWNMANRKLSPKEIGILNIACQIPSKIPTDKQSPILIEAEKRAMTEGFFIG